MAVVRMYGEAVSGLIPPLSRKQLGKHSSDANRWAWAGNPKKTRWGGFWGTFRMGVRMPTFPVFIRVVDEINRRVRTPFAWD